MVNINSGLFSEGSPAYLFRASGEVISGTQRYCENKYVLFSEGSSAYLFAPPARRFQVHIDVVNIQSFLFSEETAVCFFRASGKAILVLNLKCSYDVYTVYYRLNL